jgi:RNA polymerase sigma factor (sigma-70 family)
MEQTGKPRLKQDWAVTEPAFRRFLEWLDEATPSNGERYLEMRRRLVRYFDRKNCLASDDLADETLNRVARRLDEEGKISEASPAQYCYIVAKYVFLEHIRQNRTEATSSEADLSAIPASAGHVVQDAAESGQELLECLEMCLQRLPDANRQLILEYYRGEQSEKIQRRRQLAEKLGLTPNALSIRACRIREELEACTRKCSLGR